ncbi:MAG: hypothetical protein PHV64_07600, partial [Bacteroidales bacterium]|nr:hypothetical protein [Bacteroidales bacterium]
CMIGGQAGIVGHLTVAARTQVGAQAGVIGSVKQEGSILLGMHAFDHGQFMRAYAHFKKSGKKDL